MLRLCHLNVKVISTCRLNQNKHSRDHYLPSSQEESEATKPVKSVFSKSSFISFFIVVFVLSWSVSSQVRSTYKYRYLLYTKLA